MKLGLSLAVLVIMYSSIVFADEAVMVLTDSNFDSVVDGTHHALVKFYAPWCGHCKSLAPEYEKVGQTFNIRDGVVIGKVDATAHKKVGNRFGIQGFPTLKWFPQGSTTAEDYNGGRTAEDFIEFINSKTGLNKGLKTAPTFVEALTPKTFDALVLNPSKNALVEFYAPWCGHCKALAPVYELLGETFTSEESVVIAKVDAEKYSDLAQEYEVSGFPTLKWFAAGDDKVPFPYEGGRDLDSFVDFVNYQAGTSRKAGGALSDTAGLLREFDDLVTKFSWPGIDNADVKLIEQMVAAAPAIKVVDATLYLKIFKKIVLKGDSYPKTEVQRLRRMLDNGNVKPAKKDLFQKRINILSSFGEPSEKEL